MTRQIITAVSWLLLFICIRSALAEDLISTHNNPISSNPAAVNVLTGSGDLQNYLEKKLAIQNNYGIRIGGNIVGDVNQIFSGGIPDAKRTTFNGLFLLGMSVDTEKFIGWRGGLFDAEFLQFNGQSTNAQAGTVQGYNSLPGAPPLNRSELYKLWFQQAFLDKKLFVRIGKTVPSLDFDNVIKPVPLTMTYLDIPAVSGLTFTPLFVNASMLGVMPGYYNSAYGLTINFVPTRRWNLSYGVYDGNLARGIQTGLTGPTFNGAYFHVVETGFNWVLGKNKLPGDFGIGAWHQSGLIQTTPTLSEQGATGYYLFGTQRFWYKNRSVSNSGISSFYQYGKNNSSALNMTHYLGAGLTAFGLAFGRENDSLGVGGALSWLNQRSFNQRTELLWQAYYQAQLSRDIYLEPVLTYIPNPAAEPQLSSAWTGIVRMIIAF